tara:strand:- start:231 stop:437 length:207 start_codon:yes stop_codon:yes gene_type:complete
MTNQLELIKEVKSEINNTIYRVRKLVVQEINYYMIECKVDFGYAYCHSAYSKEEMENDLSLLLNQKLY